MWKFLGRTLLGVCIAVAAYTIGYTAGWLAGWAFPLGVA